MTKAIIDYSRTVIYKIVCNDLNIKDVYVGHTTGFTERKYRHKYNSLSNSNKEHHLKIYKFIRENGGWNNWSMIEIEKFPCMDGNEARARERHWIEELDASLNCTSPTRSTQELKAFKQEYDKLKYVENKEKIQEYKRHYREHNRNYLKEKAKQYYSKNKEQIQQKKKIYAQLKKDEIKERLSQPYTCECGSVVHFNNKTRHFKSQKHQAFKNSI